MVKEESKDWQRELEVSASSIRSQTLSGEEEARYVKRLMAILRAARLNDQYPDGRRLGATVRALDPEIHRGEYDGVQVNLDSGLPTYREFTRVQTDVSIAADQLARMGTRKALAERAANSPHEVHARQLAKYDYYDDIKNTRLISLGDMEVSLRRVDPSNNTAHFRILFDKLDVSGIFLRYHILLSQRAQVWGDRMVRLDEDTASHTEEFKALIYRFSSLDAEFVFSKLASLSGVEVERVCRGTVGPIYFGGTSAPAPFDELLGDDAEKFVAMFALDTAATDVSENRNNDPFGALFESELSRKMRPTYGQARTKYGYRVYRDRKFVVSRGLEAPLRELCEEMGTKNIIYGA